MRHGHEPNSWDHPVPFTSWDKARKERRIFGGIKLIAAEESRSREGRQYAEVLARADAARARLRPALGGRCKQSFGGVHVHENLVGERIARVNG
jgi:hypothetical protein